LRGMKLLRCRKLDLCFLLYHISCDGLLQEHLDLERIIHRFISFIWFLHLLVPCHAVFEILLLLPPYFFSFNLIKNLHHHQSNL